MNRIVNRHPKTLTRTAVSLNRPVVAVNCALLIAAAMMVAYYVIQANLIAALHYDAGISVERLASLREQSHAAGAEIAAAEHPDRLLQFAKSRGMVLASDASYVAAQKGLAGR